jgi:hypothetical protein
MSQVIRNGSTCLVLLLLTPVVYADATRTDTSASPDHADLPKELSVAPLDHIEYPDDRPEWISRAPTFDEDSFSIVVVSGPCETPEESLQELKLMQRAAVSTFVTRIAKSDGCFDFYPISDEVIDRELVTNRHAGQVTQGDMTKYEHAVEIRIPDARRQQIVNAWKNIEVRDRLGALGVVTFCGLVMLICSSALISTFGRRFERRERIDPTAT